ncbi:AICAR transformylase/IMP cyclohydrolase PurH [Bradyrhizobium sp. USDA 4501]
MTEQLRRVTRALLSVSDKAGLIDFAKALADHGVELVSTGAAPPRRSRRPG